MPGAHKIGAAISGPRIAGGNFMDTTLFLIKNTGKTSSKRISGSDFAVRPRSGPGNVAEICALSPDTNLRFANLRFGNPRGLRELTPRSLNASDP